MLTILWHEDGSEGYTDLIPDDWVSRHGTCEDQVHVSLGPRSGRSNARCDVKVDGSIMELDYRPYKEMNNKQNIENGVLRIRFDSEARESIAQILWKEPHSRSFQPCSTTVTFAPGSEDDFEIEVAQSLRLSSEERKKRLRDARKMPARLRITTVGYRRNPDVVAEVLYLAQGICQRCKNPAPFKRADTGEHYLEVHHRKRLADGGEDTVENAIALCPNCHREVHYG